MMFQSTAPEKSAYVFFHRPLFFFNVPRGFRNQTFLEDWQQASPPTPPYIFFFFPWLRVMVQRQTDFFRATVSQD